METNREESIGKCGMNHDQDTVSLRFPSNYGCVLSYATLPNHILSTALILSTGGPFSRNTLLRTHKEQLTLPHGQHGLIIF